jgi:hypothetical protein
MITNRPDAAALANPSWPPERTPSYNNCSLPLFAKRWNVATFCVAETAQFFNKNVTSRFSTCYWFWNIPGFRLTYPWVTR